MFARLNKQFKELQSYYHLWKFLKSKPGFASWIYQVSDQGWPTDLLNYSNEYLASRGQTDSVRFGIPVDRNNSSIPWFTYPFIDFLEDMDLQGLNVLEFGAGQSTLYWQRKGCSVLSFELDLEWHKRIKEQTSSTVSLHHLKTTRDATELVRQAPNLDIAVIDAKDRLECARMVTANRSEQPLIILDNADWFPKTAAYLREQGFTEIRFKGPGPINSYSWCTTLFLPQGNTLITKRLKSENRVSDGIFQTAEEEL